MVRFLCAFACVAALLPIGERAQAAASPVGPSSVRITCAIPAPWQPGTWFLGTEAGLYRRAAADPAWTRAVPGSPLQAITGLAASQHRPGWLLAAAGAAGLFRSEDDGATWLPSNLGLAGTPTGLAADPLHAGTFLAATGAGTFRSTDYGLTWAARGLAGENVDAVAFDPAHAGRAWAVVYGNGIFRTTDGGASWVYSSDGIYGGAFLWINDVMAAADGDTVFAVGQYAYRSIDGGVHWDWISSLPGTSEFYTVALPFGSARTVLMTNKFTALRSTDGGSSWLDLDPPIVDASFLLSERRVFGSVDGSGEVLLGAHDGELLRGASAGEWFETYWQGISGGDVYGMAARNQRWIAGGAYGCTVSEDGGRSWKKSVSPPGSPAVRTGDIEFSSASGMIAWAGGESMFFTANLWKTTDGGRSWRSVWVSGTDGGIADIEVDEKNPDRVYFAASMASGAFVYRSTDGGGTWTPAPMLGEFGISALQIDAEDGNVLLAGTGNGVYRSTDGGASWSPRGLFGLSVRDLSVDASDPAVRYAATNTGVWKSANAGLFWSRMGTGLPDDARTVEGSSAALGLLAGTREQGLWHLDGNEWNPLPPEDQPLSPEIARLLALKDGGLLAATLRGALAWSPPVTMAAPEIVSPFDAGLIIRGSPSAGPFELDASAFSSGSLAGDGARIDVFAADGRPVVSSGALDAAITQVGGDAHRWIWDGRDRVGRQVPSGIYFVRVQGARGTAFGKICTVR